MKDKIETSNVKNGFDSVVCITPVDDEEVRQSSGPTTKECSYATSNTCRWKKIMVMIILTK